MIEQRREFHTVVRRHGIRLVHLTEDLGLSIILLATLLAGGIEVHHMWLQRQVLLQDLLLLFIYVETVSMVKVYWNSGKLPVRMPLYIAMVAIARYLIIDVKEMEDFRAVAISSSILIVALAVFVVRWCHVKLPYPKNTDADIDVD
jgi:protein PsiE